jgi:peroxiredoxin
MRIVAALMLTFLMPALSFGAGQAGPSKKLLPLPKELQGNIIPDFYVLAIDNETEFSREKLAKEVKKLGTKRVVISFFASWCIENCGPEFVKLKENANTLKEKGVSVYLIDVGEKIMQMSKEVSDFVNKYAGDSFPFYFNQNASMLKNFGIIERNAVQFSLPVVVVMDENLKVLNVFTNSGNDFPQVLWGDL